MHLEEGVIERVSPGKAWVRIQRHGQCSSCSSRDACRTLSDKEMLVEVDDALQVEVGDRVQIGAPEGALLRLTFLVYLAPVIALIAGAYAGSAAAAALGGSSTLWGVLGGAAALAGSFGVLRLIDQRIGSGSPYRPRMIRRYPAASSVRENRNDPAEIAR